MSEVQGKVCTKCGVLRPVEEFHKHKLCKGGRTTHCKYCVTASTKAWVNANKEKAAAHRKAWREANKETLAASHKAWATANKERVSSNLKAWRAANKEKTAGYSRAAQARYMGELHDLYVKRLLKVKSPTPELIELKREQLKMYRLTKQLQQLLKEKTDGSE